MIRKLLMAVRTKLACSRQNDVNLNTRLCFGFCKGGCFEGDEPVLGISCAWPSCCGFGPVLRRFLMVPFWSFDRTGATHDASEMGAS